MLLFVSSLGAGASFYLLLTVVPAFAIAAGVSETGVGLATGVLMLSTVAAEVATPRLAGRFGSKAVFAVGLVMLGAPALALTVSSSLAAILAVCLVRGLGFGITVVIEGELVAALMPDDRRGEGLGLYGVVCGVPAVVALPIGVWLAGQVGFQLVFICGAAASLLAVAVVPPLPERDPDRRGDARGARPGLERSGALRLGRSVQVAQRGVGMPAAARRACR